MLKRDRLLHKIEKGKEMVKEKISPKIIATSFGILVLLFLVSFYLFAWEEPISPLPGDNVPSPLNVGAETQTKEGGLNILGNVGIGKATPTQELDVAGNLNVEGSYWVQGIQGTSSLACPEGYAFVPQEVKGGIITKGGCMEVIGPDYVFAGEGWFKLVNRETGDPADPTVKIEVVCWTSYPSAKQCELRSSLFSFELSKPIVAVKVTGSWSEEGSIWGVADDGGGGCFVYLPFQFSGIGVTNPSPVARILTSGTTPSGNSLYDFSGEHPPDSASISALFVLATLPSGEHNSSTEGNNSALYWNKVAGLSEYQGEIGFQAVAVAGVESQRFSTYRWTRATTECDVYVKFAEE